MALRHQSEEEIIAQLAPYRGKSPLFDSIVPFAYVPELERFGKQFSMQRFDYGLVIPYQLPQDGKWKTAGMVREEVDEHSKIEIVKRALESVLSGCEPRSFSTLAYRALDVLAHFDNLMAKYVWYVSPKSYVEIQSDWQYDFHTKKYRGVPVIVDSFIEHGIIDTVEGASVMHRFHVERLDTELQSVASLTYERKYRFSFQGFILHVPTHLPELMPY